MTMTGREPIAGGFCGIARRKKREMRRIEGLMGYSAFSS
jgi:hypothetical protein